ncbi:MAG: FAD-binding protein [Chloroflexi bacterium]|nr:FAD-binding protein [Chloroflexota bacterium]
MLPDFINELKKRFNGDLRLDPASKVLYSTDASIYQIEPLGVAIPRSQDDLLAAVELAVRFSIPILPRGAGSSLGGQSIGEALILDCSRYLDALVKIDPESQTAVVEPGVVLADLNRAAAKHGLMFGPDPASAERATMGGVIGNNATGAHSILYGMSADHLLAADVILGDGSLETWDDGGKSKLALTAREIREKYADSIKQNFPRSWRNSAGYRINYLLPWSPSVPPQWDREDYGLSASVYRNSSKVNLAGLLAGSEGTLAVMRRATVNLVRRPKYTILGILAYESIVNACRDVPRLLEFKPSAIELIPRMLIRYARSLPGFGNQMGWLAGDPAAVLVVEFSGDQPSALKDAVRRLGNVLAVAESLEEQARVWNVRKMGLGILDSRREAARPVAFIEDCAVPVEHLGEFVEEVERIMHSHQTDGGIYAHASGGCLHIRPILDLHKADGVRSMRSIAEQVLKLVLQLGGSMSSEHGDGIISGEWIRKTYGAEVVEAMRMIKKAADPGNLLNPGKMLDAPPMDTHLRYGGKYQNRVWRSTLQFEHERGLTGAIEHCNGQGVCRKSGGVMCPSFQATREEQFSTRGRANLLRALTSSGGVNSLQRYSELEPEVFKALDLCLACKGCTSECPSGVDMPRLKYEFMHEYFKTHNRPLHDYLFGYFHVVSRWLSPVAPLANLLMGTAWLRELMGKLTGITEKRPLPVFALSKSHVRQVMPPANKVIFLSDVFSRYLEPQVEQAAFDILSAAGYEVLVLPVIGAGASFLSKGFLEAARRHAEQVLKAIKKLDNGEGLSVVGCEPPEIYCLKHEYIGLLPEFRSEIESLAGRVWLVEEFLLRSARWSDLRVATKRAFAERSVDQDVVTFHPHCHQRAEGLAEDGLPTGTDATATLLRDFGFQVNVMEAGCCGMAGTFGYDMEHYELSMQIGELGVLPRARAAKKVVSTGSACRMQIRHGAGRDAEHPLLLVSRLLTSRENE